MTSSHPVRMSQDFWSPSPKCRVLHLPFGTLGKTENDSPSHIMYFKELSNDKAIHVFILSSDTWLWIIHVPIREENSHLCLSDYTLLMELFTEVRVELRVLHPETINSQKSLTPSGPKGQRRWVVPDSSERWGHEGGADQCDHHQREVQLLSGKWCQSREGTRKTTSWLLSPLVSLWGLSVAEPS